jgi:ATP-dependent helicase HrpB
VGDDAAVVAALLGERDIRVAARSSFGGARAHDAPSERSDVVALLDAFREAEDARFSEGALRAIGLDPGATFAVDRARKPLARMLRRGGRGPGGLAGGSGGSDRAPPGQDDEDALLLSILAGYPDRVAKRKGKSREIAIAGGTIAELAETSVVRHAQFLVAVDAERRDRGRGASTLVRLASAIEPEWLIDLFPASIEETDGHVFDANRERVERVSRMTYDGLALTESRTPAEPGDETSEVTRVLAEAALAAGGRAFAPEDKSGESALDRWLARVRFAATVGGPAAPSDADVREALVAECVGKTSFDELRAVSFVDVLRRALGAEAAARVEALAPESVRLTAARSARIHYEADTAKAPWIESYLQDFFGVEETPRIGGGRVALVLHLLAPNRRAVQVTQDLEGFWERHYPGIRKEMARKYPRQAWPESPRGPNAPDEAGPGGRKFADTQRASEIPPVPFRLI